MRDTMFHLTLVTMLGFGFAGFADKYAFAGGGSFENMDEDDEDAGPPYVGDVKDSKGNPVAEAKVSVAVKAFNSSLILRADDQGHFHIKGFDKSVNPDEVEISCSMYGYKPYALNRQPTGSEAKSPIEVMCVLEKL